MYRSAGLSEQRKGSLSAPLSELGGSSLLQAAGVDEAALNSWGFDMLSLSPEQLLAATAHCYCCRPPGRYVTNIATVVRVTLLVVCVPTDGWK